MAIMIHITKSDCPGCYSAFRPTTGQHGVVEKKDIPKRIQKEVERKGSAWAYPPRKAMEVKNGA